MRQTEHNVSYWPIATKSSSGLYVSFWDEAEAGRAAEFAASVEDDPERTSVGQKRALSIASVAPHPFV